MNWIVNIFKLINQNWTSRVFSLVFILLGTYSVSTIFKAKAVKEDCTAWQEQVKEVTEQNRQLIGAFIEIKKELSVVKPVAYYWNKESGFEFASVKDTVPSQRTKEKQAVQKVMNKIDSILRRFDSINKKARPASLLSKKPYTSARLFVSLRSPNFKDMPKVVKIPIGNKFNRLTILEDAGWRVLFSTKVRLVKCVCDCGHSIVTYFSFVKNGHTRSCGCLSLKNKYSEIQNKAACYNTILRRWGSMKRRCLVDKNYSGRGISVCDKWVNNFPAFYNWAIENGFKKELQIDRIDNNAGYSPENCRWVTPSLNMQNTRKSISLIHNGVKKSLIECIKETGIKYATLKQRFKTGKNQDKLFLSRLQPHVIVNIGGVEKPLCDLAKSSDIPYKTLWARLYVHGWPADKLLLPKYTRLKQDSIKQKTKT